MEGGRGESERKGRKKGRDGDSCSAVEVIKTHKKQTMVGAYVSI